MTEQAAKNKLHQCSPNRFRPGIEGKTRERVTHQIRVTAHRECHGGTLDCDYDPDANQLGHPLHDHVVLKLLCDLAGRIFNSGIITQ